MKYALSIPVIKSIIDKVKRQKANLTDEDLINAFIFYFQHDAYIKM